MQSQPNSSISESSPELTDSLPQNSPSGSKNIPEVKRVILAIDPGQVSGIALIAMSGDVLHFDNLSKTKLADYLIGLALDKQYQIIQVVMENFVVYRDKAARMVGSKMPAVEVIGTVKFWALSHNIPVTLQMASILPLAEKQSGHSKKGQSHAKTHWIDAMNHGLYWLYARGFAKTPAAKRLEERNG